MNVDIQTKIDGIWLFTFIKKIDESIVVLFIITADTTFRNNFAFVRIYFDNLLYDELEERTTYEVRTFLQHSMILCATGYVPQGAGVKE